MDGPAEDLKDILETYNSILEKERAWDFDDLIGVPIELLTESAIAGRYHSTIEHVLVDEYQDMSPAQNRLLRLLVGGRDNICAVGDPDQSIYSFRGADVENFLNFGKDYARPSTIVLQDNYRSSGSIVEASNEVISHNRKRLEKKLNTARDRGPKVTLLSVPDERGEGEAVIRVIEARLGGTSHYSLMKGGLEDSFGGATHGFGDFAVLFRTNAQTKAVAEVFSQAGMPYQVVGGENSARRKRLVEKLREYTGPNCGNHDVAALLHKVCEEIQPTEPDRLLLEQLGETYALTPPEEAILNILNEMSLVTTADAFDPRADAVALLTLHAAKGLEFRTVFIVGAEEGLIPYGYAEEKADAEEERRLFYVGMTRAKDELFILRARVRRFHGKQIQPEPSPFLGEIPEHLLQSRVASDRSKKPEERRQLKLFE